MLSNILYIIFIVTTALAGFLVKSLTFSGAFATVFVGISVAIGFQLPGLLLLGIFFATSSLWSKFLASKKKSIEEKLEKGDARDWQQVLANGGTAAISAWIHFFHPSEASLLAFIVSIAAANSDTWASEIGVLSKRRPFYVLTLKPAERGTSGAVSLLGSAAGFVGAGLIAISAVLLFKLPWHPLLAFVAVFGFIGNLADTLLGAVVQARFRCGACGLETERTIHCGQQTLLVKGGRLITNDVINFSSITLASLLAVLLITLF
ncbi:DUF92 domain-containing protein [Peribacillus glennii]|uniref:DUF92 domain-containing protein n=1 Tax=Peribacillus glennii TaxID=2303991 RepID=A0A372LHB8_9BACI|nr:DUF92 domain-containing protein [Peribacillus glennii]RFU65705.1 DUF92 domain-containing protein [Peribacillus glennii]